jgi:hypothetical protein
MKDAARFYKSLIRLYPQSYRQAFGAQMQQTFIDWHDDAGRANGRVGIQFWLSMITDEIRNIVNQRLASLKERDSLKISGPKLALSVLLLFLLLASARAERNEAPERSGRTQPTHLTTGNR